MSLDALKFFYRPCFSLHICTWGYKKDWSTKLDLKVFNLLKFQEPDKMVKF